jgi:enamine deaminase RidA (YjgF/YER057c/UK114 family)
LTRLLLAIERHNPEALPAPETYSQVVTAAGKRLVFVAGQVALDREGNLVGDGDLSEQVRQASRNIKAALEAVGGRPADIVKITTFVVSHRPEFLPIIADARRKELGDLRPASTLIGVQALARPEFLVEIEAIAVLEGSGAGQSPA